MREHDASYVLRVWKDGKGKEALRASLKELRSQETTLFKNIEDLIPFLDNKALKQALEGEDA